MTNASIRASCPNNGVNDESLDSYLEEANAC